MKRIVAVLTAAVLAATICHAQPDLLFNNLSTKEGLTSPHVYSVTQDRFGLIWIGSDEGLFRFDGYSFTRYIHNSTDFNSSWTYCLTTGSDGSIWIGTDSGLLYLDEQTGKIEKCITDFDESGRLINCRVKSLMEDSRGTMWVGTTDGLIKYDRSGHHIDLFQLSHINDKMTYEISSLYEDSDGILWIGSFHGLYKYNPEDNSSQWFEARKTNETEQWNNLVMGVLESQDRNFLYVGTSSGLVILDKDGNVLKQFTTSNSRICDNDIRSIKWYDGSHILIGTANGVALFNTEDEGISCYKHSDNDPTSLICNSVRSIYKDSAGIMWISTIKGISKLNPDRKPISVFRFEEDNNPVKINDICRVSDTFWLGTDHGIIVCDTLFRTRRTYDENDGLLHPIIKRIIVDGNGCIWVGTNNGINYFDRTEKRFHEVDDKEMSPRFKYIYDIKISPAGHIVSNVSGGIGMVAPEYSSDGKRIVSLDISHRMLPDSTVNEDTEISYLSFDRQGQLWLSAGAFGLVRYSLESGGSTPFNDGSGLVNNKVYSLLCDSVNNLWIGTPTGLCRIDEEGRIISYNDIPSLRESIHTIAPASNGNICLATYDKLIVLNPATEETTVCNLREDLGVFEMVHNSYCCSGDYIYLGGDGQVIRFNPEELSSTTYAPKVNIISLNFPDGTEQIALNKSRIVIPYNRNSFSISFAMPAYSSSEDNGYLYRLNGHNEDWVQSEGSNRASYSNLKWGHYEFVVKGHNCDGIWCSDTSSCTIVITPPWWFSKLAISIYLLIILGILAAASVLIVSRLRLRHRLENEQIERSRIEQLNEMKLRFFTNISHEFKTPLSLISGPVEVLMEQLKDPAQLKELGIIQQNSDRLSKLISQIMDMRKIDNGKAHLELSHGDIVKFSSEISDSFASQASERNINLHFSSSVDSLFMSFDRDKVEKILMNLLSNAFKFTKNGGEIGISEEVLAEDGRQCVRITVSDTGCGIPTDDLPMVFERFFQSSATASANGTGIGLSIVHDYAVMHEGKVGVQSTLGKGSSFSVTIPCDLKGGEQEEPYAEDVQSGEGKSRIVIIDDEYDMLSFIKMNLERDFKVYPASDGETGYELIREVYPDLVICDLMMPGTDGMEVCDRVKKDDLLCHIPFIILTANDDTSVLREGYEHGADDFISKPFSVKSLVTRVNAFIEMRAKIRNSFRMQFIASPQEVSTDMTDKMVSRLVQAVEDNISNPDFSTQQLCEATKYPYQQVYRKLKSYTGQSINEFIRTIRLKRAAQLLLSPNYRISEVMDMVGFNSHSYFTKCFKELFGVSPTDYINNKKEEVG